MMRMRIAECGIKTVDCSDTELGRQIIFQHNYSDGLLLQQSFPNVLMGTPEVLKDAPCTRAAAQPAFALCTHKRWPQARKRWVQAGSPTEAFGDDELRIPESDTKQKKRAPDRGARALLYGSIIPRADACPVPRHMRIYRPRWRS